MAEQNSLCVGIDLGTTNSLIATCKYENGKIRTPVKKVQRTVDIKGAKRNDELLPSVVYYPQEEGMLPVVGDVAKKYYASNPFRVAKSIKSQMGNPVITGLQDGIEDKRPEDVSARIIRHLIADLEKHYGEKFRDVVITVPASFDPAQRLATLRAAEIAGVDVRNEDGSYNQDILLSEPEAVMYNVINQIRNDEYDAILKFDTEKKVLVFDIGGGTLDITLHTVRENSENPEILDMDLIATNRFTPVAGDTFDNYAAEAMYRQYVEQYRTTLSDAAEKIGQRKNVLFPSLCAYAEELKISINDRYEDLAYQGKTLSQDSEFDCGGIMPNGYSYDGYFTKEMYEESVRDLLGINYQYSDYKTIEGKEQTKDIIWPVLDVLRKAAKKLGTDDFKIDAVIMSGGMSRLYLVKKRLEDFFGFHVISVSNPDYAVAQGAVVYHYHQHHDSELMKRLHAKEHTEITERPESRMEARSESLPEVFIRSGKSALADAIFLGLRGGATKQLADEGQELPYSSPVISGFSIEKGQNIVRIPIQKRGTHQGELVTMASGDITFKNAPKKETPVSIRFDISRNQIITLEAWMQPDASGTEMGEKGTVTFSFCTETLRGKRGKGGKIVPPPGSRLVAPNEVLKLCRMCMANAGADRIKQYKSHILSCGNPQDFAYPVLRTLELEQDRQQICFHFIPLARKLAKFWTEDEQKRLVRLCFDVLRPEMSGYTLRKSTWRSAYNEAILTIGIFGSTDDAERLYIPQLTNVKASEDALIHAFSYQGIHVDWVLDRMLHGKVVAYRWIGLAVNRATKVSSGEMDRIFRQLVKTFDNGDMNQNLIRDAVISLGLLCDRHAQGSVKADEAMCREAEREIKALDDKYPWVTAWEKAKAVSLKLICDETLSEDDEQYLLSLYEE